MLRTRCLKPDIFFRQALALNPNHIESLLGLGVALEQTGNATESVSVFQHARTVYPEHTEVYIGLGNAFKALYQLEESARSYQKAILLKPDHVEAWKGFATVLRDQGRLEESLLCGRKAVLLAPKDIESLLSLGNLQKAMGNVHESLATYREALSYDPNHARAHLFLGLALLLAGEFEEGWKEYEWRPKAESGVENHSYPAPRWRGESLNGKRILVHCEQGFGDTFQFIRYLPLLKKMGADVIFECQPELEKFLSQHSEFGRIIPRGQYLPMYDYHCLLMSLPYLFRTDMNSIPCDMPYLRAEPASLPHNCPDILKVGIVWAGNPSHKRDKKRSIPLSALTQILDLPNVRFYSLQVGARAKDVQESCRLAHITDLSDQLKNFSDTASAIAALDLVISVDTAVAHLSGALGKPIWVMIPSGPDFRWMRDSEYSPWYPSMRLFRQSEHDRWAPVIGRVAEELSAAAGGDRSRLLSRDYRKPGSMPILHKADDVIQENMMQEQDDKMTALRPCRHGTMLYLKKDIYIGRSFDLYGEFSEGEITVFSQLIRPGDIVVEAGANIGAHTVFLAKAVGGGGKVFAYEPQRFIHQILCANIALNELTNVHTRQAALGECADSIRIPILDYNARSNFGGLSLLGMGEESVAVETIDSLNLERLKFIKADVEGMEAEVIRGAVRSIQQFRPILYVENDRVQKSEALIGLIRSLNYRLWHHHVPLFNPANFAGVQENIFGNIVSKNLICFPKEASVNIQGLEEV
ncbi:MAG: FkbM family methyltransferase [Desulfobacteraceae bacterium]|nr:FkbM family methyltransferase [Desulfobacteraceae bacterium]